MAQKDIGLRGLLQSVIGSDFLVGDDVHDAISGRSNESVVGDVVDTEVDSLVLTHTQLVEFSSDELELLTGIGSTG